MKIMRIEPERNIYERNIKKKMFEMKIET